MKINMLVLFFAIFDVCLVFIGDVSASNIDNIDPDKNTISNVLMQEAIEPTLDSNVDSSSEDDLDKRVVIECVDDENSENKVSQSESEIDKNSNSNINSNSGKNSTNNRSISSDLAQIDWSKVFVDPLKQLEKDLTTDDSSSDCDNNDESEEESDVSTGHLIDIN